MKELQDYILKQTDSDANFALAEAYEDVGQLSSAISFFIRAAEFTDNKKKQYLAILRCANCFDKMGGRDNTTQGLLKHAICIMHDRPEAYFLLSRFCERRKRYIDGYLYAEMGLKNCNFFYVGVSKLDYPGKYGLLFEKAVCAWWWGKHEEARELLSYISEHYVGRLDDIHYKAVESNLIALGSGPEEISFRPYDMTMHDRLKYKFPDSQTIKKNYAQVYQDLFVLATLKGKRNGTFLEVGGYMPYRGNNTALLEEDFGWKGTTIEIRQDCCDEYAKARPNTKVICKNALNVNYFEELYSLADGGDKIDYLQLDCEPSRTTFEILLSIPFDKYKFAVITYEHDHYMDMSKSYRTKSRKYLESLGYVLVVGNVSPTDIATFEDWWVHPDLVDMERISGMISIDKPVNKIDDYMLT
jgi:tetratricopeptide (TPR) repeat protein